jgi:nucleotide-binding universal stress UspA family protein
MIKDIVVNLRPDVENDPTGRYAISLAEAHEAHVTGVACAVSPPWPPALIEGGSADIYRSVKDENRKLAEAAIARFEDAARRSQISFDSRLIDTTPAGAAEAFGTLARAFDLAVVRQPEPGRDDFADETIEAALFDSGRPVLVVPYIQKENFSADRAIFCWDGSRQAARALADSLPILRRSTTVHVLTITTDRLSERDAVGADIAKHLARHNLKVELVRIPAADIDVSSAILSYVADTSATLMVMGGYGHSRLREFVLGGATRGMLKAMTAPTLMSH